LRERPYIVTIAKIISTETPKVQPSFPFPTVLKTIQINQQQLQLWVPAQSDHIIEDHLTQDPEGKRHIPYWSVLWPSAIALADFSFRHSTLLKETFCLEIGCGLGLSGIAASKMGAEVVYSDIDEHALQYAKENHALNFSGIPGWTEQVDWFAPPSKKYDLIIAADVLYEAPQVEALKNTFKKCLSSKGKVWLAEPNRLHAQEWVKSLEGDGLVSKVFLEEVVLDGQVHDIWIYEFFWDRR
jgi:predicted nicotinamide N-methyase